MQKEKQFCPTLRFRQFIEDWRMLTTGDILEIKSGHGFKAQEYVSHGLRLLQIENVSYGNIKWNKDTICLPEDYYKKYPELLLKENDIVIALNRPVTNNNLKIAKLKAFDSNSILYQRVGKVIIYDDFYDDFVYHLFTKDVKEFVIKKSIGSDQPFISLKSLYRLKLKLPSCSEQLKIANFLSAIDKRIQTLVKKKTLLEQYKKGVMQKVFKQELRFKDEYGKTFPEWEFFKLKEVFKRSKLKNTDEKIKYVLTNSATQGIVSQNEYFDKDIANQNNLQGYYIVEIDDFIYNPRISRAAPVGPFKRNKLSQGVMSPLYTVLSPKKGNLEFLELYFQTTLWHRYMKLIANYGARHDRMNITITDFENLPIPFPSIEEQTKIANFLSAIDISVELVTKKIEHTKTFKKGLLQQMFV